MNAAAPAGRPHLPSGLIVRRAGPADARPLAALLHLVNSNSPPFQSVDDVARFLADPRNFQIVAEEPAPARDSVRSSLDPEWPSPTPTPFDTHGGSRHVAFHDWRTARSRDNRRLPRGRGRQRTATNRKAHAHFRSADSGANRFAWRGRSMASGTSRRWGEAHGRPAGRRPAHPLGGIRARARRSKSGVQAALIAGKNSVVAINATTGNAGTSL